MFILVTYCVALRATVFTFLLSLIKLDSCALRSIHLVPIYLGLTCQMRHFCYLILHFCTPHILCAHCKQKKAIKYMSGV